MIAACFTNSAIAVSEGKEKVSTWFGLMGLHYYVRAIETFVYSKVQLLVLFEYSVGKDCQYSFEIIDASS